MKENKAVTTYIDILSTAVKTLKDRKAQYGSEELGFDRTSKIATLILNKEISPYDVAMIMVALKLGRLQESRSLDDHYVDGINYMAFAAQFVNAKPAIDTTLEDGIAAIAKRFSQNRGNLDAESNSDNNSNDVNGRWVDPPVNG